MIPFALPLDGRMFVTFVVFGLYLKIELAPTSEKYTEPSEDTDGPSVNLPPFQSNLAFGGFTLFSLAQLMIKFTSSSHLKKPSHMLCP